MIKYGHIKVKIGRIIKMAIEKGVNKFSKKFLDLIGIEKELVGFRDDVELYYCKGVNSIFETV